MIKITSPSHPSDSLVLRAFGPGAEPLTSRPREVATHSMFAAYGLAPGLLARFSNGLVYRFLPGKPCSAEQMASDPRIWRGVAKALGRWHAVLPVGVPGARLDGRDKEDAADTEGNHDAAKGEMEEEVVLEAPPGDVWAVLRLWASRMPEADEAEKETKRQMRDEVEWAFGELGEERGLGGRKLVMGHCDLLAGNILLRKKGEESGGDDRRQQKHTTTEDVLLIDYEYSVACPAAFDIALHFGEWPGFECDYRRTPGKQTRREFVKAYVRSWQENQDQPQDEEEQDATDLLCTLVDRFRGLPGLWFGLWGLVQAHDSSEEFDYCDYAQTRLSEYWAWKENLRQNVPQIYLESAKKKDADFRESIWRC